MADMTRWIPGGILAAGCIVNGALVGRKVTAVPLRQPIASVDSVLGGVTGRDEKFDIESERAVGMSTYFYRRFPERGDQPSFSVYAGYYEEQRQGKTIHSPKNCLPGGGWEPVESEAKTYQTSMGPVTVNRYKVIRPGEAAVVYYWYQGRGRVEHNELRVKFELLRDAAVYGRTEEALVRIIVPLKANNPASADALAEEIVPKLVDDMQKVLPEG